MLLHKSKKDPVRLRKLRQTSQAAFAASNFELTNKWKLQKRVTHSEACLLSMVVCKISNTQEQELDSKQKRFVSSQPWSRYPGNTSVGLSPCIAFFFGPELGKINLDS